MISRCRRHVLSKRNRALRSAVVQCPMHTPSRDAVPGIDAKLRFLASHAGPGEPVECHETHMSWVFLVGDHALKLKKPMRTPVLDFSTLAAREFNCREELRLNVRLAPGIYRGLLALQWHDGSFSLLPESRLPGPGQTVDWLVLMRRLPAHRMLSHAIAERQAGPPDIESLSAVLAPFYRAAAITPVAPHEYVARFERELAASRSVLLNPRLDVPQAGHMLDRLGSALARGAGLLQERAQRERIVEGHGDLRPEHVCLLHPPVVIDCLEFNAQLRQIDPFDEICFLALECDMAGAPWVGPKLQRGGSLALGDAPVAPLMQLYTALRAALRARLSIAHLLDPAPRTPEKWSPLAQRYIERAQAALDAFELN